MVDAASAGIGMVELAIAIRTEEIVVDNPFWRRRRRSYTVGVVEEDLAQSRAVVRWGAVICAPSQEATGEFVTKPEQLADDPSRVNVRNVELDFIIFVVATS